MHYKLMASHATHDMHNRHMRYNMHESQLNEPDNWELHKKHFFFAFIINNYYKYRLYKENSMLSLLELL